MPGGPKRDAVRVGNGFPKVYWEGRKHTLRKLKRTEGPRIVKESSNLGRW